MFSGGGGVGGKCRLIHESLMTRPLWEQRMKFVVISPTAPPLSVSRVFLFTTQQSQLYKQVNVEYRKKITLLPMGAENEIRGYFPHSSAPLGLSRVSEKNIVLFRRDSGIKMP